MFFWDAQDGTDTIDGRSFADGDHFLSHGNGPHDFQQLEQDMGIDGIAAPQACRRQLDMSRAAVEEPPRAHVYVAQGILSLLFFPLRLLKMSGLNSKQRKAYFFPLGDRVTCIPLLSCLMWICAFALGLQLYRASSFGDPKNLRTLAYVENYVSIGEPIVAITIYAGVALVVAAAVSHHPRYLRMDSADRNRLLEAMPFALSDNTYTRKSVSVAPNPFAEESRVTSLQDHQQVMIDVIAATPDRRRRIPSLSDHVNATQQLLDESGDAGFSPPPAPLAATVRGEDDTTVVQPAAPRRRLADHATMEGPLPRRYVPFSHILFDEVPPLKDSAAHFVYDAAEWFEPQRRNRKFLDQSLALFKAVFTQQQKDELEMELERRRAAKRAGVDASAMEGVEGNISAFALVSADTAEWKPSDLFKFTIGDRIRRNGDMPLIAVSFDGETHAKEGDKFVISNRMWHEDCALYCVEGGSETHQWQAIEALFDVDDEIALDGSHAPRRRQDKAVSTEALLLAMSGRDTLRRLDPFGNGNVASAETAMYIPPWNVAINALVCLILAIVPMVQRDLQGGGLSAKGTLADVLCCFASALLVTLCATSIMVFLATTRKSLENYADVMDTFTEVTLGAASNKWYPLLNWYETTNIRAWFHLREHIITCFAVHYNARLSGSFGVLVLASCWSYFGLAYCLSYPQRSRPTVDGWLFQAMLLMVPLLWELRTIFLRAAAINATIETHKSLLAQIQVALEEEVMLVAARTVNRIPGLQLALMNTMQSGSTSTESSNRMQGLSNQTIANKNVDFQYLLDAKTLLDDVRFCTELQPVPLTPFGLVINHHLSQFVVVTSIVNVAGIGLALAGFVLLPARWAGV